MARIIKELVYISPALCNQVMAGTSSLREKVYWTSANIPVADFRPTFLAKSHIPTAKLGFHEKLQNIIIPNITGAKEAGILPMNHEEHAIEDVCGSTVH